MIEIPITKGYTAIVSDEDADLADVKWWANIKKKSSSTAYVARNPAGSRAMVQMHRVVMARVLGRDLLKSEFVDHINNVRTDNRRENLRIASNAQNMSNRQGPQANNKAGFKGVCWSAQCRKWLAQIAHNKQHFYLGVHIQIEDAAKAYDRKAIELHGEFASLNFDRSNYD